MTIWHTQSLFHPWILFAMLSKVWQITTWLTQRITTRVSLKPYFLHITSNHKLVNQAITECSLTQINKHDLKTVLFSLNCYAMLKFCYCFGTENTLNEQKLWEITPQISVLKSLISNDDALYHLCCHGQSLKWVNSKSWQSFQRAMSWLLIFLK